MASDEEAEIKQALQKELRKNPPVTAAGCLLRGAVVAALLMVVASCGGYFGFRSWMAGFIAKRDAYIEDLRAKGEPLSAEDLAKFTALPKGTPDLTERYLGILKNYFGQVTLSPEEQKLPIVGDKGTGVVPGPGIPWAEEDLAKNYLANRPWLIEAEDLAEVDGEVSFQHDYSKGFATLLPEIQAVRLLARDLQLQFQVRMRAGDRAGAMRSLRAMFKTSLAMEREPILVSQLVRVATHAVGVQSALEILRDGKATSAEIAAIRSMLDNDFRAGLVRALQGERATVLISLSSSSFNQANASSGRQSVLPSLTSNSKMADLRPGDTTKLLEMLTDSVSIAEANDFPEMLKQFRRQEDTLKQMVIDEKKARPWDRLILPTLLMPSLQGSGIALARTAATERALKAALDVEEKLLVIPPGERTQEAEIAAIMEALPNDPFTGQPMKYVVDEQGYKIYSVGSDGVDDGGPDGKNNNDAGVWIERMLDTSMR